MERKHVVDAVTQGAMTEAALRAAARRGDELCPRDIETPHIKVDSGDENERTAFFLACQEGKAEIAKIPRLGRTLRSVTMIMPRLSSSPLTKGR